MDNIFIAIGIIFLIFVVWVYVGSRRDNPIDPDDPNLGSNAEERRREYFIKTPLYQQFMDKWNKNKNQIK